jgi:hypothetical protein
MIFDTSPLPLHYLSVGSPFKWIFLLDKKEEIRE